MQGDGHGVAERVQGGGVQTQQQHQVRQQQAPAQVSVDGRPVGRAVNEPSLSFTVLLLV